MLVLASSEEVESEDPAIAWTVPDEDDTAQFTEGEEAEREYVAEQREDAELLMAEETGAAAAVDCSASAQDDLAACTGVSGGEAAPCDGENAAPVCSADVLDLLTDGEAFGEDESGGAKSGERGDETERHEGAGHPVGMGLALATVEDAAARAASRDRPKATAQAHGNARDRRGQRRMAERGEAPAGDLSRERDRSSRSRSRLPGHRTRETHQISSRVAGLARYPGMRQRIAPGLRACRTSTGGIAVSIADLWQFWGAQHGHTEAAIRNALQLHRLDDDGLVRHDVQGDIALTRPKGRRRRAPPRGPQAVGETIDTDSDVESAVFERRTRNSERLRQRGKGAVQGDDDA